MTEIANSLGQTNNAESILSLAQKLYDEHVAEGESVKARLIGDAEVEAERILFEAQAESERLRNEANEYHETTIAEADKEVQEVVETSADRIAAIHENISSLQQFEAHYRSELNKLITETQNLLNASIVEEETEQIDNTETSEEVSEDTVKESEDEADDLDESVSEVEPLDSQLEDNESVVEEVEDADEQEDADDDGNSSSRPVFVL